MTNISNNESLNLYLKSIHASAPIKASEQRKLFFKLKDESIPEKEKDQIKEAIVKSYLNMVVKIANKIYRKWENNSYVSLMDMISEGNIGLMKAIDLFDLDHNSKANFSTYAWKIIHSKIYYYLSKYSSIITIPSDYHKYFTKITSFYEECGENASDSLLMKKLEISPLILNNIKIANKCRISYLEDIKTEDEASNWEELIENVNIQQSDEIASSKDMKVYLFRIMGELLSEREQQIVYDIYFDIENPTLNRVSKFHNLSRERIRQISASSINKIRERVLMDCQEKRLNGFSIQQIATLNFLIENKRNKNTIKADEKVKE